MSLCTASFSLVLLDKDSNVIVPVDRVFSLPHNTPYTISLHNHDPSRRIDAEIEIDGKSIGEFRIAANSHIAINRPSNNAHRLTFFALDSVEGRRAGLDSRTAGSICVTIRRESNIQCDGPSRGGVISNIQCDGPSRGGTGLGAISDQKFAKIARLDYEPGMFVIHGEMKLDVPVQPLIDVRETQVMRRVPKKLDIQPLIDFSD